MAHPVQHQRNQYSDLSKRHHKSEDDKGTDAVSAYDDEIFI